MASKVYSEKSITLQDGTDVTLRPLPIGRLRRFMDAWGKIGEVTDDAEGYSVFINCAGIGIEHEFKGKFDALKASVAEQEQGEFLSPEYKEYCEDTLDLDTIYEILEVAGGLKLNDPKLLEAAQAMATLENQEDGTN